MSFCKFCQELDQFDQIKYVTAGIISDISEIAFSYIVQQNRRIILIKSTVQPRRQTWYTSF